MVNGGGSIFNTLTCNMSVQLWNAKKSLPDIFPMHQRRLLSAYTRAVKLAEDLKRGRQVGIGAPRFLLFVNRKPLMKQSTEGDWRMEPVFLDKEALSSLFPEPSPIFLSVGTTSSPFVDPSINEDTELHPYYAIGVKGQEDPGVIGQDFYGRHNGTLMDLRMAMFVTEMPQILAKAQSLLQWRNTFKSCPRCKGFLNYVEANTSAKCSNCGSNFYPTVSPCVITLVADERNENLLLARQKQHIKGLYTCIAGFCEAGESLESVVRREVAEEVGVVLQSVEYARHSQYWPWPQGSLMSGFIAKARKEDPLEIDLHEIEDAQWFSRNEVAQAAAQSSLEHMHEYKKERRGFQIIPPPGTAANKLINGWLKGLIK